MADHLCPCEQLLDLSESAAARPELLKTHKQRVEELNTYLSKLSEHHDMPKIGPG
jgi:protein FAM32A